MRGVGRGEGATAQQLELVGEARAEGFVGSVRLEEAAGGYPWCNWRTILLGGLRLTSPPPPRA